MIELSYVERRVTMEDVIKKIIKIEEKAQEIMSTTINENNVKRKEAEEKLAALEEQIVGHAHIKAKELRKSELRENAVIAKEIKAKCDVRLKAMEEKAAANKEAWVTYLLERVIGD